MTMQINGSVGITFPDGTLQVTAALGGSVTGVTAVAPLSSSGGINPAISLTGIVSPANGGTGAASLTGFLFGNGASPATPATAAQLTSLLGSTPVAKATNIDGGAANQIPFQSAPGVTAFIPAPTIGSTSLEWNGTNFAWTASTGSVSSVSVVGANGFAGTVATPNTTPAITISTSVTGVLKGDGTAISAATAADITTLLGTTPVTSATNLDGGGANQVPYQTAAGVTAFAPAGTINQTFKAGAGGVPAWSTPANLTFSNTTFNVAGPYNDFTAVSLDLLNRGITPATYGNPIAVPVLTVNAQGVITAISEIATTGNNYVGSWNASTNTPTLVNGTGSLGDYYICTVPGTADFGAGPVTFSIGDWAVYDGTEWDRVANSQATAVSAITVTSLAAGQVVLGGGTNPLTATPASSLTVGKATNVDGGAANQVPFQTAAGVTAFTASPTTTGQVLQYNGATLVWAGAAGTTSSALTVNDGGAGTASPFTFDGGTARTISYNSIGAPKADGTGASGSWAIDITGKAANIAGGAALRVPYQTAADTTAFIAAPTTTGQTLSYDGTNLVWAAGGAGTITTTDFTATAGQTVFGVTYTVGLVSVYRNGIKLGNADYTASNGTSITLTTGAIAGDLIEVQAFQALNLSTSVSSFNTRTGAVTLTSGDVTTALGFAPSPLAGSTSLTTVGTITSGTWNGSTIDVPRGGTGVTTLTGIAYGNGTSAFSAATAAQVVGVIGTTPVTNATNATAVTNAGGWSVTPTGTKLFFNYNGTNVGSLDSTGNFVVTGNVTAFGTP